MRKICIIFLLSIIITVTALGFPLPNTVKNSVGFQDEFLRIHIRADSNENAAQSIKYAVRDELVAYLVPIVAECETKTEALQRLGAHASSLRKIAERTLKNAGFSYGATVSIEQEIFPTRVYDNYTLPAGEYTALIVRLGSGKGDNWWCVVYPPLCFVAQAPNVVYKSKIAEIIRSWQEHVSK
ncbi:MAG: stage II sporulation protein R [Clostridia bacterium]|nr:stage II sporulation protein R [Clostridia bacterium]